MTSSGKDSSEGPNASNLDDRLKARLDDLDRKLEPPSKDGPEISEGEKRRRSSALGKAFRLSTELVAGVIVGGGLGWALDRWLGTKPFLLLLFLLLGVVAGLLNAVRTARDIGRT